MWLSRGHLPRMVSRWVRQRGALRYYCGLPRMIRTRSAIFRHFGTDFRQWSAGKTILIEYRYASADPAQMDIYAAELVGLPAEAILAGGSLAVAALRRATQTTPIVSTVAMLCHLRPPSLLMRARALATVREWKKRLERQAHSRSIDRGGCGLPVETGAMA